ncbi:MAG: AsmA-like C-terminal region-containing protein [Azonexus sp.]|jgi:hypothetical protein|nr:AsmA-like C-terminal region-containing protein [Azonexus sp.]
MDSSLIYAKTAAGNEAVRQGAQLVQRNMRVVLLQIDGRLSVQQLIAKIGSQRLVEDALQALADKGLIETTSVLPETAAARPAEAGAENSIISQFSTFGSSSMASVGADDSVGGDDFTVFGRSTGPSLSGGAPPEAPSLPPPQLAVVRRARPKRRFAVGRWLSGGLAIAVAAALAAVLLYPYDHFRPALETALARQLAAPVRVGAVHLGWLPQPRLLVDDVTVSRDGEWHIATLAISSPWRLLGDGGALPEIEAGGVRLTANQLLDLPFFSKRGVTAGGYSPRRLRIADATVTLGDLTSGQWRGEILFDDGGSMEKTRFDSADGSLHLEMTPAAQGLALALDASGWQPEGLPFGLTTMQASGFLQRDRLLLEKLDANALGGQIRGNWQLDWSASGMAMSGEEDLTRLDSRQTMAALLPKLRLEGELSGALRMRANGRNWQEMLTQIEASLDAKVTRGQLVGIDLGELARNSFSGVVRSGTTRFETLQARLDITPERIVAQSIQLDGGLMTASGRATIDAGGQIEGNVTVQTHSSILNTRVPAKVSGALNNMVVTATVQPVTTRRPSEQPGNDGNLEPGSPPPDHLSP